MLEEVSKEMTERPLEEVVEEIVKDRGTGGATLEDVSKELAQRGLERSPSLLRTILRRLALSHKLVVDARPTGKPGNQELVYYSIDVAPQVMGLTPPVRRSEMEEALETEYLLFGGMAPLVESVRRIVEGDPVIRAVEEVAEELADEDPKGLFLGMADWAAERARQLEAAYLNAVTPQERHRLLDRLKQLGEFVDRVFRQVLNIDRYTFRINARALERDSLSGSPERGEDLLVYHRDRVERLLKSYVFGDKFVEVETVPIDNEVYSIASTDASVQELPLWQEVPSLSPGFWATREVHAITTSAASLQIPAPRGQPSPPLFDFDVDPRQLKEYDRCRAMLEGRLLPSDIMHQLGPDKWERSKFAAMNIRQYDHDQKVLSGKAAWRREDLAHATLRSLRMRIPTVIFHDGRLFPLEHRIDNIEDPSLYGDFVRSSVEGLVSLAKRPEVEKGRIVVTGVVKTLVLPVFSPLILWYLHTKKPNAVGETTVLSTPYPDPSLLQPILKAKARKEGFADGKFVVTCRVLRRFATLAGKALERARLTGSEFGPFSPAEWEQWFEDVYLSHEETELAPHQYENFIYASGHIGVLDFFLHPADGRLQPPYTMPRYEILVSSRERTDFVIETERERLRRVLQALAPRSSLAEDPRHEDSPHPLIVPAVLVEADRASSLVSEAFRRAFIAAVWELYQEVKKKSQAKS